MKRGGEGKHRRRSRKDHDQDIRLEEDDVPEECYKFPGSSYGASQGLKYDESEFLQAVKNGSVNRVKSFLDQGVSPNFTILPKRETLLHVAVRGFSHGDAASEKITRLLLFFGCDPNFCDYEGVTPLHIACAKRGDNYDCIEMLLQIGANPNATNPWTGGTPLMTLCSLWSPRLETVRLLVECGADPCMVNREQQNVLHLLCHASLVRSNDFVERSRIVGYLLDRGVSASQIDSCGKTPLSYELLCMVYFFHASEHPICQTTLPNVTDAALTLVAGGSLSHFQGHEDEMKSMFSSLLVVKEAKPSLHQFLVSIRNVLPSSEFYSVVEWVRHCHVVRNRTLHHNGTMSYFGGEADPNRGAGWRFEEEEEEEEGGGVEVGEEEFLSLIFGSVVGCGGGDNYSGSSRSRVCGGGGGVGFDGSAGGSGLYNRVNDGSSSGGDDGDGGGGGDGGAIYNNGNVGDASGRLSISNYSEENIGGSSSSSGGGGGGGRGRHGQSNSYSHNDSSSYSHNDSSSSPRRYISCHSPLPLMALSRIVVRNCLRGRVFYLVSLLESVPGKIQDYLKALP